MKNLKKYVGISEGEFRSCKEILEHIETFLINVQILPRSVRVKVSFGIKFGAIVIQWVSLFIVVFIALWLIVTVIQFNFTFAFVVSGICGSLPESFCEVINNPTRPRRGWRRGWKGEEVCGLPRRLLAIVVALAAGAWICPAETGKDFPSQNRRTGGKWGHRPSRAFAFSPKTPASSSPAGTGQARDLYA